MTDKIISIRMDKAIHKQMKEMDYINWSALIRKSIRENLEKMQEKNKFDRKKAENALKTIKTIRKSDSTKKTGAEIIREWRDKRKF